MSKEGRGDASTALGHNTSQAKSSRAQVQQDAPLPLQRANELKFTPWLGWVQLQLRLLEEKGLPAPTPQSAREPCGMLGGSASPVPAPLRVPPALPVCAGTPRGPEAHRARAERHHVLPGAGWLRA